MTEHVLQIDAADHRRALALLSHYLREDTDDPARRPRAKYRRRLREAEAERDALQETVTAMRRADVERIAADVLKMPNALWKSGIDVGDLLDDNGRTYAEKVTTAAETAREALGLAGSRDHLLRGNVSPREGANPTVTGSSSWETQVPAAVHTPPPKQTGASGAIGETGTESSCRLHADRARPDVRWTCEHGAAS